MVIATVRLRNGSTFACSEVRLDGGSRGFVSFRGRLRQRDLLGMHHGPTVSRSVPARDVARIDWADQVAELPELVAAR